MYTYTDFFLQSKDSDIGSIAVWTWRGRAALAPAVCYSMLRCVAVGVLLYVAFCCRCGLERSSDTSASSVLHYIAVCYSQRVVVCCSTLQFAAESANWRGHIYIYVHIYISWSQLFAINWCMSYSGIYHVLQSVALCCSVLQSATYIPHKAYRVYANLGKKRQTQLSHDFSNNDNTSNHHHQVKQHKPSY